MTKIVVAITGSIAAYKAAHLVRLLRKAECEVRVVMTKGAKAFIAPMTLQALSGHPVVDDILDPAHEMGMGHIELSRWADQIIIAPCSANMLAKLAHGLADDLVSAMCLASPKPIHIAPSMNRLMWSHPMTVNNVQTLTGSGRYVMIAPESGEQACGEVGEGRMAEPEHIAACLMADRQPKDLPLEGKKVVITGGPTREAIDPVRYISNHSSGKMAAALADAFHSAGADVTLVLGPCEAKPNTAVTIVPVESAQEMLAAVESVITEAAIFVGAAAVADYRVETIATHKMKKTAGEESITLTLVKNPDILATVAARQDKPFVIGFAAETDHVIDYAKGKLVAKGLDMICANDVSNGQVFGQDENHIVIIDTNHTEYELKTDTKQNQAKEIVRLAIKKLAAQK
ncbi:bifunctional phosphopantothenoylcysteine decarboxylase/phosphopantothenate--cysteine ligase CoaBC [Wohlfahrtiimonas chitiniclastica]|uniref:bifunctional phosphopantothenoylcysteine decarboxylase/phosphopantothenate--cysteine ligase CoaBC n=1 Tax=Wohlfahrtiimonas chitiniclastica TaxID=400946 RepID=UPI001BCF93ED|nr:bifunctional phosphopantothenoylcysteine decarboxylase/phosphopantothenate--cysteine ligase CoaBC [Wohlfahrtiimonas chitiniclastica]MBS7814934.1 bifunctional phosphopantothenoylcysteine decarboxylase/phosphopantothenate--cysteine ligase CoaBC [Wohlfahrtiimonas chitiniclastica]MBS7828768.1 bifunctional phosphopantothenoylcysteine decarboxylase/phosphopantothenate--cysteine ligase CoaBC [Wohlfahrtiimonas chitiniclastica]